MDKPMKAISLWQPWASLVVLGEKRFETRSWSADHRGDLAIHAAKRITSPSEIPAQDLRAMRDTLSELGLTIEELPLGAVLGTVNLVAMHPAATLWEELSREPFLNEASFGNFDEGRFAWELTMPEAFDKPVPTRGYQGLWNWTPPIDLLLIEGRPWPWQK